jgi:hypothetical protein
MIFNQEARLALRNVLGNLEALNKGELAIQPKWSRDVYRNKPIRWYVQCLSIHVLAIYADDIADPLAGGTPLARLQLHNRRPERL